MDPNIPPSFTSLHEGDNSPQIGGNNTNPITPTNPHMYYPLCPLPNYHHQMYQPYYSPQPDMRNPSGGSYENFRNYPPPYYPPPSDAQNVHNSEYPHYPLYYPPPPSILSYCSAGSNSTPSSTPTGSPNRLGNSESGSSKRSYPDTEEVVDEVVVGNERLEGRKAAKRRLKEKDNNAIGDLVTKLKELSRSNSEMSKMFEDLVSTAKEEKIQKMMMRERKLRLYEDRIMMMDTSALTPQQQAYYKQRRAEIMQRRLGQSSSTQ